MRYLIFYTLLLIVVNPSTAQPSILLSKIAGSSAVDQYNIASQLRKFPPEAFTDVDRSNLGELLFSDQVQHLDRYFLLTGYLKMQETLRSINKDVLTSEKLKRSYNLALIRAGDTQKGDLLLGKIRTMDYDDDFVYDVVPLLIYTHNRNIYDFLIELTLRPNTNCLPPDPHREGAIDCGYRMMEYLAPVLVDFPIELDAGGDLKTNNYRSALTEVREWLRRHRNNYQIVTNRY
ncbi:MAG: hypothetical protein AAF828_04315 [Bacteroidota bacterium]